MEVQKLLETAASPTVDAGVRTEASAQLQRAAAEHFGQYMAMLAQTLAAQSGAPETVRTLAALALKNELTAKNDRDRALRAQRWASPDQVTSEAKTQIRATALASLGVESHNVSAAAAQLVAAIAAIELPRGEWKDLTAQLVAFTSAQQPAGLKKAALTAIGYICETANPADKALEEQMNGFLTAIVQAAQRSEPDETVRLAAINALSNSLEFIRANFEREGERNLIMTAVCEATQATGEPLQSAAFGCLAKIMHHYYEFMRPYMEQALFALTVEGMRSPYSGVQTMAIEFWSTVSEAEFDLEYDEPSTEQDQDGEGPLGGSTSFHFVAQALPQVLPPILKLLVKEDEDQDDDEWNVQMAAGTCLELMAKAAGDAALDITMSFVAANIQASSWNEREAAVMAFGSVLDGPTAERLVAIVHDSLTPLAGMIRDQSVSVRETVAWCLGRIADLVIPALDSPQQLQVLLEAVGQGLQDDPRVIVHCCWAIMNLSEQLNPIPQQDTSPLSPFYDALLQALVATSGRADNEHSARTSAYEALSSLVIYSPNDALPLVMRCSATCDERMRQSLLAQGQVVSIDDRQNVEELQINLLGLLTSIIRRVESEVLPVAGTIMELLGQFLATKFPNSLVEDDIFIAIGAVASSIGEAFATYVPHLIPHILHALSETELPVSSTAVGLISDITHALGEEIAPYVAGFMQELSKILAKFDSIRPELVPPALACIGDLAAATGPQGHFDVFLGGTEQFLAQIGQATRFVPEASVEQHTHVASVKEAILDAHVGIVAGYRDAATKLEPFVPGILEFLADLSQDHVMIHIASRGLLRNVTGLIGDIGAMYPQKQFRAAFEAAWVNEIIHRASNSQDQSTRDTGRYALHEQKLQLS